MTVSTTISCARAGAIMLEAVAGDAEPSQRTALSAHLAACDECAAEWQRWIAFDCALGAALAVDEPPPAARARLLAAVREAATGGEIAYATMLSPIGPLLVAASPRGLYRIAYRTEESSFVAEIGERAGTPPRFAPERLQPALNELREYFAGQRTDFDLPVDLSGVSPFTRQVLLATRQIPCGTVVSYADIARRIGKPAAARAVGNALGRNPLAIVIPCHRVVASDGGIGGYSGGLDIKRRLLALEGIHFPDSNSSHG